VGVGMFVLVVFITNFTMGFYVPVNTNFNRDQA
jgi:hypothetical protein